MVGHLRHVYEDLAARVADGVALAPMPPAPQAQILPVDLPLSPALQTIGKMKGTLKGRVAGILIHDGSDAATIKVLRKAMEVAGAAVKIVAPKVGGATLSDGKKMPADGQLAGTPSVSFDAVAVVLTDSAAKQLTGESAARDFVSDAIVHLKAIAADSGAVRSSRSAASRTTRASLLRQIPKHSLQPPKHDSGRESRRFEYCR